MTDLCLITVGLPRERMTRVTARRRHKVFPIDRFGQAAAENKSANLLNEGTAAAYAGENEVLRWYSRLDRAKATPGALL